jgi:NHL repeat-containing protein
MAVLVALAVPAGAQAFGPLSSTGSLGDDAGELDLPSGVAIGTDGASYVADNENNRISVFAPDGTFLRAFGKDVRPGGGDVCTALTGCQAAVEGEAAGAVAGAIRRPAGVAFGPGGELYVGDSFNSRISVFAPDGSFLRAFGKGVDPGGGDVCTTVCQRGESDGAAASIGEPRGLSFDASGLLYVADFGMHRVAVFTAAGEFVRAFGKNVDGDGKAGVCTTECHEGEAGAGAGEMLNPTGVAATLGGLVAVADGGNNRVVVFSDEGGFVRAFGKDVQVGGGDVCTSECQAGTATSEAGAISAPEAIGADASGGLFVGEWGSWRVSRFSLGGEFVSAFGEGVVDGEPAFQICTVLSGCQEGGTGAGPGAVNVPSGFAFDCRGALYVSEWAAGLARVERFGEPGTAPPPCSEPVPPIAHPSPEPELVAAPESKFQFGKLVLNRRRGTATLFVFVPGRGRLVLRGGGVLTAWRSARRPGRVKLPVRPIGELKRKLRRKGRAKGWVRVTFRPTGGLPRTKRKQVLLLQRRR